MNQGNPHESFVKPVFFTYPSHIWLGLEPSDNIRWLQADKDYALFLEHLQLCGQNSLPEAVWSSMYEGGIKYCGLFRANVLVARAAIEPYHEGKWDVGDIRVVSSCRCLGYGRHILAFTTKAILNEGRIATCYTRSDNAAMLRVLNAVGYEQLANCPHPVTPRI